MKLLKRLTGANGVSGNEKEVRDIIEKEIKKYVDSVKIDEMGNLIAIKKGKKPRVMLAAHMDEIGVMAKAILPCLWKSLFILEINIKNISLVKFFYVIDNFIKKIKLNPIAVFTKELC